jgi:hypothetical protein
MVKEPSAHDNDDDDVDFDQVLLVLILNPRSILLVQVSRVVKNVVDMMAMIVTLTLVRYYLS